MSPETERPSLSLQETFSLIKRKAEKGSVRRSENRKNFIGVYDEKKYLVSHLTTKHGYEAVDIVGVDFAAGVSSINGEFKQEYFSNDSDQDLRDILERLVEEPPGENSEAQVSGRESRFTSAYNLEEYDRDAFYPTETYVVAESDEEARRKYLEWRAQISDFHSMEMLYRGIYTLRKGPIKVIE